MLFIIVFFTFIERHAPGGWDEREDDYDEQSQPGAWLCVVPAVTLIPHVTVQLLK